MKQFRLGLITRTLAALRFCSVASADPFYMGGDISLLPFIELRGGTFRDAGQVRPMERIMANHGANMFRLRLFVNPNTNYSATNGAIQDLSYTIALAQRLQATGADILLDLQYSDTWADPGQQAKPAAWNALTLASNPSLQSTVRQYTASTLTAFKNAGVMPKMVQVGNEITNGMLYNDGKVVYTGSQQVQNQSWANFGTLLNSAIQGVRDVDAQIAGQHTDVAIHVDGGNVAGRAQYYFNQINNVANVSDYDVMGMSFYPVANGTTSFNNLKANLNYLANNFNKKVMVLEANQPWFGASNGTQWPVSEAGQNQFLIDVRDFVRNLPNGRGAGVLWWYPEAIQVPGTFIFKGGAISMFGDQNHNALASINSMNAWKTNANGNWSDPANWITVTPNAVDHVANFGPLINSPRTVTVDSPKTVGVINFDSANRYTINGGTVTLDVSSGNAAIQVTSGSHTIASPVVLNDDLSIAVNSASSVLSMTGALSAAGRRVTKEGAGAVQIAQLEASALAVNAGTVTIAPGAGAGRVGTLNLGAGATPTTTLDLSDNDLILTATPSSAVVAAIVQAWHNGAWDQVGLTSSAARTAAPANKTLGTVTGEQFHAAQGAGALFDGVPIADSDVLVKFTYYGDSDLNGVVNFDDYARIDSGFNNAGTDWFHGDFDLNGIVDFDDYSLIDQAFNTQSGVLGSAVPEPSSTFLLNGLAASAATIRRIRRCT